MLEKLLWAIGIALAVGLVTGNVFAGVLIFAFLAGADGLFRAYWKGLSSSDDA